MRSLPQVQIALRDRGIRPALFPMQRDEEGLHLRAGPAGEEAAPPVDGGRRLVAWAGAGFRRRWWVVDGRERQRHADTITFDLYSCDYRTPQEIKAETETVLSQVQVQVQLCLIRRIRVERGRGRGLAR
jgi:hypothetical protein